MSENDYADAGERFPCYYCGKKHRTPGWRAWHVKKEHPGEAAVQDFSRTREAKQRARYLQDFLARTDGLR